MGASGRNVLIIFGGYVITLDEYLKKSLCIRNVLVHYVALSR